MTLSFLPTSTVACCCWRLFWLLLLPIIVTISASQQQQQQSSEQVTSYIITPREYLQLRSHLCDGRPLEDASNSTTTSHRLAQLSQFWFKHHGLWADHCQREPTAWRWAYVHELDHFQVLIGDQSIDQRLANVLYTSTTSKIFDIDIFRYNSGDPHEDARNQELVAGPQVDDERCGHHLRAMLGLIRQLEEHNEQLRMGHPNANNKQMDEKFLRLARALDSFGRYDSGHLLGKTMVPGAYEQCLRSELQLPSGGDGDDDDDQKRPPDELVRTRYCWARLKLDDGHLDESLRTRQSVEVNNARANSLLAGVCLPATCHSKSFQTNRLYLQQLLDSQFRLPKSMYVNETLELDSIFCLVDEDSDYSMPLAGKLLLLGLASWTLLAIYITYRSSKCRVQAPSKAGGKRWLQALDLNESWRKFLYEDKQDEASKGGHQVNDDAEQRRRVQLDALNMLKVFFSGVVVMGHSMLVTAGYSMEELRYLHFAESDFTINGMFTATLSVDTYFTITGLLMAYLTMRTMAKYHHHQQQQKKQKKLAPSTVAKRTKQTFRWLPFFGQWLVFTLNRYLRIVPLLALVYWFKRWVFIYLGSGPFWDFGFNRNTKHGACVREHWLVPFTFWSAYLPLSRQCLLQSWSISNDLFFSLLAPPILLLLSTRPRLATVISVLACLASIWAGFVAMLGIRADLLWEISDLKVYGVLRFYNITSQLYSAPHLRASSLLIGVLAGYHLYHYNEKTNATCKSNGSGGGGNQKQLTNDVGSGDTKREDMKWPRWFRGPATSWAMWTLCIVIVGVPLGTLIKLHLSPYHRLLYVHLMTTVRVIWSLANAVVFVRLTTDWSSTRFGRMSSSKFWKIASRLNYAILLLHMDILLFNAQISRTTQLFSKWIFLSAAASAYLLCIPLALYLHIFIENPLEKLIRMALFDRDDNNNTAKRSLHSQKVA